jgi:hypothetical protein
MAGGGLIPFPDRPPREPAGPGFASIELKWEGRASHGQRNAHLDCCDAQILLQALLCSAQKDFACLCFLRYNSLHSPATAKLSPI